MKKITLLFLFLATLTACEKEETPKDPPPAAPDSVEIVLEVDEVSTTTVALSGDLEYTGTPPKEIGVIYSLKDAEEEHTVVIPVEGNSFSTTLTGLTHNTTYEVKAYAKQNDKTFYSDERSITTESGIFEGAIELNTQEEVDEFGENGYVEITGKLFINEHPSEEITSLEPLHTLQKLGSLSIGNLKILTSLNGLHNLRSTEAIHISGTSNLESIAELSGIATDQTFLMIHQNANLTTLKGLENIPFAQQVEIKMNPLLTTLQGLEGLEEVHDLILEGNGITSLEELAINKAEELQIVQNQKLESINALSGLENLNTLIILSNPVLASIAGLENLQSIDGYIFISHNASLTNLDPFANLEKGNLGAAIVDSNTNLSDFCGAQHLFLAIGEENYSIERNKYNPTYEDFQNGDCKL